MLFNSIFRMTTIRFDEMAPMKSKKSNTIIPVAAKIYFEASCYDITVDEIIKI